jgi:hypothetical protein
MSKDTSDFMSVQSGSKTTTMSNEFQSASDTKITIPASGDGNWHVINPVGVHKVHATSPGDA